MASLFDAFMGNHFDPVFSDAAVARWAEHASHIDLESYQSETRRVIREVVRNAMVNHDPGSRIALIQGEAGLGKTHAIIAELWKLSREQKVYPAIMQLSVKLAPGEISLWMLRSIVNELGSTYFADEHKRTPLKRLAVGLWQHARGAHGAFERAVADGDDSQALALARTSAPVIRRALQEHGISSAHEPVIAGLLLAADDQSYAFRNWLRGGTVDVRFGNQPLPPLTSEADRHEVLVTIATLAAATGAPLLIVFDQIEAVSRVADHALLGKVFASAVQLVEHGIRGTGVVFSALGDTYARLKQGDFEASFTDRIEKGVAPIRLRPPVRRELRGFIDKRAAYLLKLSGMDPDPAASQRIAPDWLLARSGDVMLRPVFANIRAYRKACGEAGRFLAEAEYSEPGDRQEPVEAPRIATDFDKLWSDAIDADVGMVASIPDAEKAELFEWLASNVAAELPHVGSLAVERSMLDGQDPVVLFDLQYRDGEGIFERWKIGVIDAPNAQGRLRDQIATFLDRAHHAFPAILRIGSQLPRINAQGEPVRSIQHVRGLHGEPQAGPPLADLLDAGGRIAPTQQSDWIRLRLVRKFAEERRHAAGFADWRQRRRFLLETAGIGAMTRLFPPKAGQAAEAARAEGQGANGQAAGNGRAALRLGSAGGLRGDGRNVPG